MTKETIMMVILLINANSKLFGDKIAKVDLLHHLRRSISSLVILAPTTKRYVTNDLFALS